MAIDPQDFAQPGLRRLKVTGGQGKVTVETDPEAVGARVYYGGSEIAAGKVRARPNGDLLEITRPGSGAGGGMSSTFGNTNNSITGNVTGAAIQADDITGGISFGSDGGLHIGGFGSDNVTVQIGGKRWVPEGSQAATTPTTPPEEPTDLHIVLPPGWDAEVNDVSDGVMFSGNFGRITASGVTGDITTRGKFQHAKLNANTGDINIQAAHPGSIFNAKTAKGSVDIREVFGFGTATTSVGNVTVHAADPSGPLSLKTSVGNAIATIVNNPDGMNLTSTKSNVGDQGTKWGGSGYAPRELGIPEPTRPGLHAGDLVNQSSPTNTPAGRREEPKTALRHPLRTPDPEEVTRLERAKRHAELAERHVDWQHDDLLFESIGQAYGLADVLTKAEPKQQADALSKLRARLADQILDSGSMDKNTGLLDEDTAARLGAMHVATAIGWMKGSAPLQLYAQLQESEDLLLGMPPDVQSVAFNITPGMQQYPKEIRELFHHDRVRVSQPSMGGVVVEVLPVQQPTNELLHLLDSKTQGRGKLDEELAEKLREMDDHPAMSRRTVIVAATDSGSLDQDEPLNRQLADAVNHHSSIAYPPITSSGALVDSEPVRHLLVTQSAKDEQGAATYRLRTLATSLMPYPNTVDVFTPDGTDPRVTDSWAAAFPSARLRRSSMRTPRKADIDRLLGVTSPEAGAPQADPGRPTARGPRSGPPHLPGGPFPGGYTRGTPPRNGPGNGM